MGVVFEGLGDGSLGLVSVALPEAVLLEAGGVTTVSATVRAPCPAAAVSQLVETVTKAVPAAVPLHVDLAYDLARRGELPGAFQLGRRWRVSLVKLRATVHGPEDGAAQQPG